MLKIGDIVASVETQKVGRVIDIGDPHHYGDNYALVAFCDPVLLAMTDKPEDAICEDDTQWLSPFDLT